MSEEPKAIPQLPPSPPDGRYKQGSQNVLVAGGEVYLLSPFERADFDAVETYLRSQRKPAVDAISSVMGQLSKASPEVRQEMLDRLYNDLRKGETIQELPQQLVTDFLDSPEGAAYTAYLMLRKARPEITLEKSKQVLQMACIGDAVKFRDEVSFGLTELGQALKAAKEKAEGA